MNPFIPITRLLRGIVSLLNKIFYGLTHPIKGLEMIIRLLKNRAFSLVLFFGSGILIYIATMDFLPILLKNVYPDMTEDAAISKSMQIAIFSEIMLGVSKIKKLKWTSFGLMLLVMSLSMSGFLIEIGEKWETLTDTQVYVQLLFGIGLNGLPVLATWIFGNDASKVSQKKRKKYTRTNQTNEERGKKHTEILEAFDSGSFSTIGEIASYAGVQNETVTRVLKEHRTEKFSEFKRNNRSGRKPKTVNPFKRVFG